MSGAGGHPCRLSVPVDRIAAMRQRRDTALPGRAAIVVAANNYPSVATLSNVTENLTLTAQSRCRADRRLKR
ncbi:hypothetical protein EN873_17525 [bacterium M00.F.Ca.ET.230.01.1.1]|nr:hypothetical protein EN873_17525 [bacterium M00.F.Ca.ET.230.01.1.1]